MRIVILCTHLNPGGISRYVINLAQGLSLRGHQVWVGCAQGGKWEKELEAKKIRVVHIPITTKSIVSPKILFSFFALRGFLRREKIEVVHCNTRVTQMLGFLIFKMLRIPYVSTFHGFYTTSYLRRKIKLCGVRTIAVSRAVSEHLAKDLHIDHAHIRVVHNGIDVRKYQGQASVRKTHGFNDDDFLIGVLGRISEEKGHVLASQAFSSLSRNNKRLRLLLSGTGKIEKTIKEFFDANSLNALVHFLDMPAPQFLSLLDILLVPSRKEGFGFSVVEAFAAGVPVVGFNTGGIAELIRNRENGLLFYDYTADSLASAIGELSSNSELRRTIVAQAKSEISLYSIERMASQTECVYQEALR